MIWRSVSMQCLSPESLQGDVRLTGQRIEPYWSGSRICRGALVKGALNSKAGGCVSLCHREEMTLFDPVSASQ